MSDTPITHWITRLEDGDDEAAHQLWLSFSEQVHQLARRRLDSATRRRYDEHDAANSAFFSLCRGISDGRIRQLDSRDNFWRLLAVITTRKISEQQRNENRQKRGSGLVRGDSVFAENGLSGADATAGSEPTPHFSVAVIEACQNLLDTLEDPMLQQITLLKFEGYVNGEIARKISRTRRTVERKLEVIRRLWNAAGYSDSAAETQSH